MQYKKLVGTLKLTREEWVDYRRKGIGGSDVGAIAGINPWSTSYDVWQSKVKSVDKEFSPESIERMYWGTKEESLVCERFTELTGIKLQKCNYILQSKRYPFMFANVDRLVKGEKIGFEAKTTEIFNASAWEDGVPESYQLQIQHYMAVTGFRSWYIAVKIGNSKFKYFKVDRDEEIIKYIIEIEEDFWNNSVLTNIPPRLGVNDTQAIKDLFKISNGQTVPLDSSALALITEREQLKAQKKDLDKQIEQVENGLKLMLGENEVGTVADFNVTYKMQSRTSLDSTSIKNNAPDIFAKYAKTKEFRVFDVKKAKGIK